MKIGMRTKKPMEMIKPMIIMIRIIVKLRMPFFFAPRFCETILSYLFLVI